MKRMKWIDLLRGWAMILVVLAHSGLKGELKILIYSFHMPLFFFISGVTYGMKPMDKKEEFSVFAKKKAKGLLIPYFFWSVALIPTWWLNFCYFGNKKFSLQNMIKGILYSNHAANHPGAPNNAMWYLPAAFLVALLFWLCVRWAKENETYLTLLVLGLLNLGFVTNGTKDIREPWHLRTVLVALFFYFCGYLFMRHYEEIMDWVGKVTKEKLWNYLLLCAVLLIVGGYAALLNGKISMHASDYHSIPLFLIASLSLMLAFTLLSIKIDSLPILNYIGQNTLAYLIFHIPLLRFFQNYWRLKTFYKVYPLATSFLVILLLLPVCAIGNKVCPGLLGKKKQRRNSITK